MKLRKKFYSFFHNSGGNGLSKTSLKIVFSFTVVENTCFILFLIFHSVPWHLTSTLKYRQVVNKNVRYLFYSEDEWVPAQPAAAKEKTLKVGFS